MYRNKRLIVLIMLLILFCVTVAAFSEQTGSEVTSGDTPPMASRDKSAGELKDFLVSMPEGKLDSISSARLLPIIRIEPVNIEAISSVNAEFLANVLVIILEERLKRVSGIQVLPMNAPFPEYFSDYGGTTDPDSSFPREAVFKTSELPVFRLITSIGQFKEECLSGGWWIRGVRSVHYSTELNIDLVSHFTSDNVYSFQDSHAMIDRSLGFRRKNIRLSMEAADILFQPIIDKLVYQLSERVKSGFRVLSK